jgi:hypothetical protein
MGKLALFPWGSENKVKKRGAFFNVQKVTAKTPRQPHNSPCCHHDFTITKHPKIQKSPYKTASSPRIFFSNQASNSIRLDLKHADPSPRPSVLRHPPGAGPDPLSNGRPELHP